MRLTSAAQTPLGDPLAIAMDSIEEQEWLDGSPRDTQGRTCRPHGPGPGCPARPGLGHPLHPVMVQLPIGAWTSAAILDLFPGESRAAAGWWRPVCSVPHRRP